MSEATIIGIDLAKRVFQLHGARNEGSVVFRKKLSRGQLPRSLHSSPRCRDRHGSLRDGAWLGSGISRSWGMRCV